MSTQQAQQGQQAQQTQQATPATATTPGQPAEQQMFTPQPRMNNPAMVLPGAYQALRDLATASSRTGLSKVTTMLVHLRASQINGCSMCVHMHAEELRAAKQSNDRIDTVAAWRESPYFTPAERAALALTESVTRLSDRPEPVSDEVYAEASRHYDEQQLAALILAIATINVWNRLNATVHQTAGPIS